MESNKQQTAMQQLINYIQDMQDNNFVSDIEYIKEEAIKKLEMEKQQIIDAKIEIGMYKCKTYDEAQELAEDYYNKTFNQ